MCTPVICTTVIYTTVICTSVICTTARKETRVQFCFFRNVRQKNRYKQIYKIKKNLFFRKTSFCHNSAEDKGHVVKFCDGGILRFPSYTTWECRNRTVVWKTKTRNLIGTSLSHSVVISSFFFWNLPEAIEYADWITAEG